MSLLHKGRAWMTGRWRSPEWSPACANWIPGWSPQVEREGKRRRTVEPRWRYQSNPVYIRWFPGVFPQHTAVAMQCCCTPEQDRRDPSATCHLFSCQGKAAFQTTRHWRLLMRSFFWLRGRWLLCLACGCSVEWPGVETARQNASPGRCCSCCRRCRQVLELLKPGSTFLSELLLKPRCWFHVPLHNQLRQSCRAILRDRGSRLRWRWCCAGPNVWRGIWHVQCALAWSQRR